MNSGGEPLALPMAWAFEIKLAGVTLDVPCLYEWHIEGAGCYVGEACRFAERIAEYRSHIEDLINAPSIPEEGPDGDRDIHRHLARAVRERRRIAVCVLENVEDPGIRKMRRRSLIAERRYEADRGGPAVLNPN